MASKDFLVVDLNFTEIILDWKCIFGYCIHNSSNFTTCIFENLIF